MINHPENLPKFEFVINTYTRNRGKPAMLSIFCSACNQYLMSYQKDGPGPLLRCYLDRIHYPDELKMRQHGAFSKKSPNLVCGHCMITIGMPMIYEKENRPAYLLRPGFFSTKKFKISK